MAFETVKQPLASRSVFARRVAGSLGLALTVSGVSLAAGIYGYHAFGGLDWIDSFANASMILSGMGPLSSIDSAGGKLFEGFYALYSGLVLVATTGLILAPIAHRFLHRLHLAEEDEG